ALEIEREASARLRSLDELKNTFLQAVSHDLRTPLTSLLGSALTLEREDVELGPEVQADLVRRIAGNARKLLRLVTDLLDLDRLSQGLLEPQRATVDLAQVVRNVVAESDAVADRDVSVVATTTTVAIDVPKVERIVENLLVNAARHTPPNSHIWIRVQPGNGGAILAVEDDGPGLLPEDRERVFGAFERGVNAAPQARSRRRRSRWTRTAVSVRSWRSSPPRVGMRSRNASKPHGSTATSVRTPSTTPRRTSRGSWRPASAASRRCCVTPRSWRRPPRPTRSVPG